MTRRGWPRVAIALTLALVGCKRSEGPPQKPVVHKAQFPRVPADAVAVASFDLTGTWSAALDHNFGLVPVHRDPAEVRAAVSQASTAVLGFDITRASKITLWTNADNPETIGGAIVEGFERKDIQGAVVGTHRGVDILSVAEGGRIAPTEHGLLVGSETSIKHLIDVSKGKKPSIPAKGSMHSALLDKMGPSAMTVTLAVNQALDKLPAPLDQLSAGAVTVNHTGVIRVAVTGSEDALNAVQSGFALFVAEAAKQLDTEVSRARKTRAPMLVPLVLLQKKWKDLVQFAPPKRVGNAVVVTLDTGLPPEAITTYVLGVGGLVLPTFIKNQQRILTTEAIDQLDRLYRASAVYYATPKVDAKGRPIEGCRFPDSVGPTPAFVGGQHPCCADGGKCKANAKLWSQKTWKELQFSMDEPHYFIYQYTSNGLSGDSARFTITAHGDLDCDGVFSTFERYGYGDAPTDTYGCSMKGTSAFYKDKETE